MAYGMSPHWGGVCAGHRLSQDLSQLLVAAGGRQLGGEAAGTLLVHPRSCCFQWNPLVGCLHCLKTYFSFYFFEGKCFKLFLIFILIIKLGVNFDVGLE